MLLFSYAFRCVRCFLEFICVAAIGAIHFSCVASAAHFLFIGGNENEKVNLASSVDFYTCDMFGVV